ncbi:hypothetical protein ALISP_3979 [Alicycliphilus sp. B1]|nr:hypothetical protein ALISP_3979 [Alicycliphilus sp. B1]
MHGAAQRLAHAVEAHAVAHGLAGAEGVGGHEDDVGPDGAQALVVQPQALERARRHVGDDHVGARDQLAHDVAALGAGEVQRQGALVAVELQEHRPLAALGDGHDVAVLPAFHAVDADDLGPVVGQQGRAVGPRDEAAEIENLDAF